MRLLTPHHRSTHRDGPTAPECLPAPVQPKYGEPALVRRARAGDRQAFAALWVEHSRRVRAVLAAMLPVGQVEDALQDVALAALSGLPGLRNEGGFVGWLCIIARNHARSLLQARRRVPAMLPVEPSFAASAPELPDLEAREIVGMIDSLPRTYRVPLRLRFVRGMRGQEIARRLGMTHGSLRVTLCRGLKLLRERVERG